MRLKSILLYTLPMSMIIALGTTEQVTAQRYPSQEVFGKNRVQYKTFNWKIFRTTNFEIYHYQGGADLAKLTAQYAESEFDKITDVLGWTPYNRVKIFLYNSPAELEQSNMGLNTMDNRDDEKLDLAQSRVEVAYTGDQIGFRKKLVNDISLLFLYDMLYGGNMKEALQSSLLLTLPEWFMSGTAAYISEGWSPELNDYMRDFFKNRNIRKPTLMTGTDAKLIGHSIWNYVAERYGKDKISDILNLTRIIRSEQNSITSTLGVASYNRFLRDWKAYYLNLNNTAEKTYVDAKPTWKSELSTMNSEDHGAVVKISQDQKFSAVSEIKNGKYKVYVYDNTTGSRKIIRQGRAEQIGAKINSLPPLLGWGKNNSLSILASEGGNKNYYVYEGIGTKKIKQKMKRNIRGLDQIVDMDVSADGTMLAVSADRAGKNDVYLISVARASLLPLTNDLFDDMSPRFVKGSSRRLVFASNRPIDSLGLIKGNYKTINNPVSLFEHDGTPRSGQMTLLLQGEGKYKMLPVYADDKEVLYLSDANGLSNIYKLDKEAKTSAQITNYNTSIRSADINLKSGGTLAYSYLNEGRKTIGFKNGFDANAVVSAPVSNAPNTPAASDPGAVSPAVKDSSIVKAATPTKMVLKEGEVDTDHYEFDEDVLKTYEGLKPKRGALTGASGVLSRSRPSRDNIAIKGPYPYKSMLLVNDASSEWRVDPLRGFGFAQNIVINDLLENHVFKAGGFLAYNLRSNDMYLEYNNNKRRIDFGIRVDRKVFDPDLENYRLKYRLHQVMFTASYPFSPTSRLSLSPMFVTTSLDDQVSTAKPWRSNFGALRAEYVFDNSKVNGMNMMEGTRFKAKYEVYQGLSNGNESFNRISFDLRHYQKIHRDLIFAIRAAGSHSGGKAPKQNIMGGMDNWISKKFEDRGVDNVVAFDRSDQRDIFFADFVNLRGFRLNRLNGTSYMSVTGELRVPLVKYLYRGSITSSFLRNLQFVGFGDIGTAWTGKGPFNENSSLNTSIIGVDGDTFRATVTTYKNPYLIGYGAGVRTTLFGIYAKFDYAWGIDNGYKSKPIPYVTLGYDF